MRFGIIGAGVVGITIAVLLERAGYYCIGFNTRSQTSADNFVRHLNREWVSPEVLVREADLIFITTHDGAIRDVAEKLSQNHNCYKEQVWIHCSGLLGSEILRVNDQLKVKYISLHPLQAFADVRSALELMSGTHFGIEGEVQELGEKIVKDLGGVPHRMKEGFKPLYHAGAVMASNFLVTITSLAVRLFELAGIDQESALDSLLPLMKGTLHNIEEVKLPAALTGPIARADVEVIKKHLEHMPLSITEVYRILGLHTIELAKEKKRQIGMEYNEEVLKEMYKLLLKEEGTNK